MGKSTIWSCSIAILNYQRVDPIHSNTIHQWFPHHSEWTLGEIQWTNREYKGDIGIVWGSLSKSKSKIMFNHYHYCYYCNFIIIVILVPTLYLFIVILYHYSHYYCYY